MPEQYSIRGTGAESIASDVETAISTGALGPGAELPSIRDLAVELGVNANTVAAAYRLLRERGAVETAGRRGTRVRDRPATTPRSLRGIAVPPGARDLSTGNPDPGRLPVARPGARRSKPVLYGDPPISAGVADYAHVSLTADGVPAEHLAVTAGALDGIERVLSAQLRPGDRVAVEDPGWANLLDLLAVMGFSAEPMRVDDDGPLPSEVDRVLRRNVRAIVLTGRAQNPTGAAISADRAKALRSLLANHDDVLLIEDDHCAGIAGAPLHSLAGITRQWAFVRSAAKAYGPDLRLAILAGDQRTVERVNGRLRLGPGWISHVLQDLAVSLWADKAATRTVRDAEVAYAQNRELLVAALSDRGVPSHGRSGLNVWIPVADETVSITGLLTAGWAAAAGARFRIDSPPGMRITIAGLGAADIDALADAVAESVHAVGRGSA
ncbi:aminotransferase class I/II-fold pyridoxal phosphate-dependent enzyme [Mycobacterium sp.]|uniref:aminotransferase class I/II-fold pyridoxal phosphate-dependent enzyme n=1 Tax=Mycobacterium sp. TaxID=1785 RepID=UPI0025F016C5|nr:aminotransferase class I/II-fold pyridoxal phosphate-dependent enzyme [Mycobacterium sp.]